MSPRFPGRGDGADLNAVTEPDDSAHCSVTEYIMFVAYILFNKHFSKTYYKNTTLDIT